MLLRLGSLLLVLAALAGCSPPPEIGERPVTPPDVPAVSLLPPGQRASIPYRGTADAAEFRATDGRHLIALRFPSSDAAREAFARERDARLKRPEVTSSSAADTPAVRYFRYSGKDQHALGWVSGTWLFIAEAGNGPALTALIAASGVGGMGKTSSFESPVALGAMFALSLVALLAALFGLIYLVMRSIAVRPAAGIPAVSRSELVRRLTALNAPDRPWIARMGPEADLIVEWKYADATWWGVLAKSGLRKSYRLRLYFDEANHRCGALDEFGELDWSAGLLAAPRVHFSSSFFRGVQLVRMERGVAYGLKTPTGGPTKVLDYKFDINDVKQPVIDAVTGGGWTYQPVLRPRRRTG